MFSHFSANKVKVLLGLYAIYRLICKFLNNLTYAEAFTLLYFVTEMCLSEVLFCHISKLFGTGV